MSKVEETVVVGSGEGLHARPAKLFVQAAKSSGISVMVGKVGGRPVDGSSLLSVISLGVAQGEEVLLSAEGSGAADVIWELSRILKEDHDT